MSKKMIVNASAAEEVRVAILENNQLIDLDIESGARIKQKGNIYKGIISNVEDGLEAAFVEFGEDKQGFLALSEVRRAMYPEKFKNVKKPKVSDILKIGQEVIIQVTKDEIGSKGAAVSTYLSLPGRYVVLMHSEDGGGGISKKIQDEGARKRAKDMLSRINVPDGMAVIIRTAGMMRPLTDLFRELIALSEVWARIDKGAQLGRAPTILYREPDVIARTVRDYLGPDIEEIVVDSEYEYEEAKKYFEERIPDAANILKFHNKKKPIFEAYKVEQEIEGLFKREVHLPSGGSICIDPTEALVAVDVNSGKSNKEKGHEETVYKTNLEAARELARQLRLRDLGGIIVIDFIDMVSRRHERDVERTLRESMRSDRARVKIGRISDNGTLELTRQRLKQAHRLISFAPCPHCEGTGIVRDPEGVAITALRQIKGLLSRTKKKLSRLNVTLPVSAANILNNLKRRELSQISDEHDIDIFIHADANFSGAEIKFDEVKRGAVGLDAARSADNTRQRHRRDLRSIPKADMQPPAIGPTPTFLDEKEILLDEEKLAVLLEATSPKDAKSVKPKDIHFENPLEEALFGSGLLKDFMDDYAAALGTTDFESLEKAIKSHGHSESSGQGRRRNRRGRNRRRSASKGDRSATAAPAQ